MEHSPSFPPIQRRRSERELARALWLRPRDIWEIYGIPTGTLAVLTTHPEASRRPPSRRINPSGGRKGIRLYHRAEFEAWLNRWDSEGHFTPPTPPA